MHSQIDKGLGHAPTIILNSVCNADGSATCTIYGVTVVATVNGPLEAARGDQSTDEATLEVQLRPSHGGAGPQLRHLEFLVKKTLRQIILVKQLPRSLLQLCLQITSMPRQGEVAARPPGTGTLAALLLASSMAMLAASIPMSTILAVATIEGEGQRTSTRAPSHGRLIAFSHTFAFSNQQELIFTNAEGEFAIGTLIDSEKQARSVCFATLAVQGDASPDADMTDVPSTGMLGLIEETLRRQLPVS